MDICHVFILIVAFLYLIAHFAEGINEMKLLNGASLDKEIIVQVARDELIAATVKHPNSM